MSLSRCSLLAHGADALTVFVAARCPLTAECRLPAEDHLHVVEGMQFDRGYISPYFVTDPERMVSCCTGW